MRPEVPWPHEGQVQEVPSEVPQGEEVLTAVAHLGVHKEVSHG